MMIPVVVVEPEILAESRNQFRNGDVVVEINIFVLHAAPQALLPVIACRRLNVRL